MNKLNDYLESLFDYNEAFQFKINVKDADTGKVVSRTVKGKTIDEFIKNMDKEIPGELPNNQKEMLKKLLQQAAAGREFPEKGTIQ